MTGKLFEMFGISLCLTLIIELPIGYLMGMRRAKQILLVILINILTNPAAVLLHWLGVPQIPVEFSAVLAESTVYFLFSRDENWNIPHPVMLAVICNAISWTAGVWVQRIGG